MNSDQRDANDEYGDTNLKKFMAKEFTVFGLTVSVGLFIIHYI